MQEHRDDPLLQRLLGHELDLFLDEPFDLLVEGFDPVVRVDEPPESLREFVKGQNVLGFLRPYPEFRVLGPPLRHEGGHRGLPRSHVPLLGYRHEALGHIRLVPGPDFGAYVPEEVDEATLLFGPRIGFGDRLVYAGEPVGDGDLDFLQTTGLESRQELFVRLRGLLGGDGVSDHQGDAVVGYAQGDVYGLLGHGIAPYGHIGGIQEYGEKPLGQLPFREPLHVRDDRVGDRGYRRSGIARLVDRAYGQAHLLVGHPRRVELQDDGGHQIRPSLVFGQSRRFVFAVTVPGHLHGDGADRRLDGPFVGTVPGIARVPSLGIVFSVAEEGSDLRLQKGFHGLLGRGRRGLAHRRLEVVAFGYRVLQ